MSKNIEHQEQIHEQSNIGREDLKAELAIDIARKYCTEKNEIEKLIKKETLSSLDKFKREIETITTLKNIGEYKVEELYITLKGALELIEVHSKIEIKNLKEDVEINIDEFQNDIEEYLPAKLLKRAKNPQKAHEHMLGIALGTANSLLKTVDALYQIGSGIVKTPYHLYLIASGKGEIKSSKKI